jgi:broad specificity phosphatase PhoE
MTRIYLIRHGQTMENRERIFQGRNQGTLTDEGIQANEKLALELREIAFDAIFTSTLRRAKDTARQVAQYHPQVPFVEDARLMERDMGVLQGKSIPAGYKYCQYIEEGETLEAMKVRLQQFLDEILPQWHGKTIALVSHGISIRVLKCILLNFPLERIEEIELQVNSAYSYYELTNNKEYIF